MMSKATNYELMMNFEFYEKTDGGASSDIK